VTADTLPRLRSPHLTRPVLAASARRRLKPFLLLLPSLIFLGAFTYWPVVSVAVDSFFGRRLGEKTAEFAGLGNYLRLAADPKFTTAALNNLVYIGATVLPSILLALGFALLLQRSTRFTAALRALLFFPTIIPLIGAAALWTFLFLPTIGLIDYYIGRLVPLSINWLGNPDTALASIAMVTVWKNAGYYMLFYIAALQAVPQELIEAAVLDGAGAWQRLRHIVLPLLAPTTAFVALIALIQAVTTVDHVIVMTKGGPDDATNLLLFYIFQTATELHDSGKAAAATVVTLVALFAVSTVGIRVFESGGRHAS
jgi:sn-glycerol 3-phosphate transport system permease protein